MNEYSCIIAVHKNSCQGRQYVKSPYKRTLGQRISENTRDSSESECGDDLR